MSDQIDVNELASVSAAATKLQTRPQIIHAYVRRGNLETYDDKGNPHDGEGKRYVRVGEVARLLSAAPERGRARTAGNTTEMPNAARPGQMYAWVTEVQKRILVLEEDKNETLAHFSKPNNKDFWARKGGIKQYVAEGLMEPVDTLEMLSMVIRSFDLQGNAEAFEAATRAYHIAESTYREEEQDEADVELSDPVEA